MSTEQVEITIPVQGMVHAYDADGVYQGQYFATPDQLAGLGLTAGNAPAPDVSSLQANALEQVKTRRGMVPESLWMNFPPPIALHDYSHLGGNYRERERIKRKKARWAAKIEKMDRQERLAIMDVLENAQ